MYVNLANLLSFLRIPLAFAFLYEDRSVRLIAVLLAWVTDVLDGFVARRLGQPTKFGKIIDPLSDKFFVGFALVMLWTESRVTLFLLFSMLSRDLALALFALWSRSVQKPLEVKEKVLWSGKVFTACQLLTLVFLLYTISIPWFLPWAYLALGIVVLFELRWKFSEPTQLASKETK